MSHSRTKAKKDFLDKLKTALKNEKSILNALPGDERLVEKEQKEQKSDLDLTKKFTTALESFVHNVNEKHRHETNVEKLNALIAREKALLLKQAALEQAALEQKRPEPPKPSLTIRYSRGVITPTQPIITPDEYHWEMQSNVSCHRTSWSQIGETGDNYIRPSLSSGEVRLSYKDGDLVSNKIKLDSVIKRQAASAKRRQYRFERNDPAFRQRCRGVAGRIQRMLKPGRLISDANFATRVFQDRVIQLPQHLESDADNGDATYGTLRLKSMTLYIMELCESGTTDDDDYVHMIEFVEPTIYLNPRGLHKELKDIYEGRRITLSLQGARPIAEAELKEAREAERKRALEEKEKQMKREKEEARLARERLEKQAKDLRLARENAVKQAEDLKIAQELAKRQADDARIAQEAAEKLFKKTRLAQEAAARQQDEEEAIIAQEAVEKLAKEAILAQEAAKKEQEEAILAQEAVDREREEVVAAAEREKKEREKALAAAEEAAAEAQDAMNVEIELARQKLGPLPENIQGFIKQYSTVNDGGSAVNASWYFKSNGKYYRSTKTGRRTSSPQSITKANADGWYEYATLAVNALETDSEQFEFVKYVFTTYDGNGNGEIERDELGRALEAAGRQYNEADTLIAENDSNKDGKLDEAEFIRWCALSDVLEDKSWQESQKEFKRKQLIPVVVGFSDEQKSSGDNRVADDEILLIPSAMPFFIGEVKDILNQIGSDPNEGAWNADNGFKLGSEKIKEVTEKIKGNTFDDSIGTFLRETGANAWLSVTQLKDMNKSKDVRIFYVPERPDKDFAWKAGGLSHLNAKAICTMRVEDNTFKAKDGSTHVRKVFILKDIARKERGAKFLFAKALGQLQKENPGIPMVITQPLRNLDIPDWKDDAGYVQRKTAFMNWGFKPLKSKTPAARRLNPMIDIFTDDVQPKPGDLTAMIQNMSDNWVSSDEELDFAEQSENDSLEFAASSSLDTDSDMDFAQSSERGELNSEGSSLDKVVVSSGMEFAESSSAETDSDMEFAETSDKTSSGLEFAESSAVDSD